MVEIIMNKPKFPWEKEYKFSDVEKNLIERINSFLDRPLSPRWIYYGLYDVPDAKLQRELNHVLNKARKDRRQYIKRDLVTDDTRNPTIWRSNKNLKEFIEKLTYYRDIWQNQPEYIEVWMEDQASLEAVLKSPNKILQGYSINCRYCKGFNSIGAMWESYKTFNKISKPIKVLYYGDLNPSGWAIPIVIVRQFKEMGLDIELIRCALNPEQLDKYNIQAFTKVSGDPRRKEFNQIFGFSHWEDKPYQMYRDEKTGKMKKGKRHLNIDLEKIPPKDFEDILKRDIKNHLDMDAWLESKEKEDEEDELLTQFKGVLNVQEED